MSATSNQTSKPDGDPACQRIALYDVPDHGYGALYGDGDGDGAECPCAACALKRAVEQPSSASSSSASPATEPGFLCDDPNSRCDDPACVLSE